MKQRIVLFLLLTMVFSDFVSSQTLWRRRRKELFFGSGATNFLGDLGGANQIGTNGIRDFDVRSIRPDFVVGYRYRISKETAIKANLVYAFVGGNDNLTTEMFRMNRNCNFRSPVIEFSTQYEYIVGRERPGHIYNLKGIRGWHYIQVQTYFFAGFGGIYMNPKAKYEGKWYALRPLSTEGEGLVPTRKKYSNFQVIIPLGMGLKYALNKDWSVCIEYGIRKTFTDYVDDVSKTYFSPQMLKDEKGDMAVHFANPALNNQPEDPLYASTLAGEQRGDPRDKDSYMFAFISFYYKIPKGAFTLPKYR